MKISQQQLSSFLILIFCFCITAANSQTADRWQQKVDYKMIIDFDVEKHQFEGNQTISYTNNSPDTLNRIFYHLYLNAFQPGSMMDIRSREISDPDRRVGDRISKLKLNEIGYQIIKSLTQDGVETNYNVEGTILEVDLPNAILPGQTTVLQMSFSSQVPLQIRRTGRVSPEGIEYSMSQWYPKLCEYDYQGWHANPYVGREFHGVWGDFDVEISIDSRYTLGGSGILVNANKIGRGYGDIESDLAGQTGKTTWHFDADNVHDFVWAADKNYIVESTMTDAGTQLFFVYVPGERTTENWKQLPRAMNAALTFMNKNYGEYPYPVYSFIQGGDGGMEYPMATLITGERSFTGLVGVSVHEWMHSWYQMVLATNESLYPWMDEGFTVHGSSETMNHLAELKILNRAVLENPHASSFMGYINWNSTGNEEPLIMHADHFDMNRAYSIASYTKGALFLAQLNYIVGEEDFKKGLLKYYNTWKFKHPNVNDCIRVFEKVSGLELDWYKEYWVNTTRTIDYGVHNVIQDDANNNSTIYLAKSGDMPMPLDVEVTFSNGEKQLFNIPLRIMRGKRKGKDVTYMPDWAWTHPVYTLEFDAKGRKIEEVVIDPRGLLADIDKSNNVVNKNTAKPNKP